MDDHIGRLRASLLGHREGPNTNTESAGGFGFGSGFGWDGPSADGATAQFEAVDDRRRGDRPETGDAGRKAHGGEAAHRRDRLLLAGVFLAGLAVLAVTLLRTQASPAAGQRKPASNTYTVGAGAASQTPAGPSQTGGAVDTGATSLAAGNPVAPSGAELRVDVAGAVQHPGVYSFPPGSRVEDAVNAAGGADPHADLARINLAAKLADGQQVFVAKPGEPTPSPAAGAGGTGAGPAQPVNLNTATPEQLDTLPGVGAATAQRIVAYRESHGPFASVDKLRDVPGIGEAKFASLRDLITV